MLDIYKTRRKPTPIFYPEGVGGPEIYNLDTAEGARKYFGNLYKMEVRQGFQCAICERIAGSRMDFDHEQSRGGGKQDDRIEVDGKWKNAALCRRCNTEKGSKRYRWVSGKYVPVTKEIVVCKQLETSCEKSLVEEVGIPPLRYRDFFKSAGTD